ncbi:hypothetical protein PsorP6_014054 [Peronosclerospora sorghi]|uniref:Uncharacterized protein n=1 Tax=Peronosclerospora sorghi TaxID=230839 RepID=A0ACC0VIU9_9STRA|nr:hypothetical protein PsorP6_014054 [Peronosclerospora sorghi]
MKRRIKSYWTSVAGKFKEVNLTLRTTGGACNTCVEEALGRFFRECNLLEVFQWEKGRWGKGVGKKAVENLNLGFDKEEEDRAKAHKEAEVAAKREEHLHTSTPEFNPDDSGTATEDASIEKVLSELNKCLRSLLLYHSLLDEEDYEKAWLATIRTEYTGFTNVRSMKRNLEFRDSI